MSVDGEGNRSRVSTSCDGKSWKTSTLTLPPNHPTDGEGGGLRGVTYAGGRFIVTGGGTTAEGEVRLIGRSDDGATWAWEDLSAYCKSNPRACSASGVCTTCDWMGGAAWIDAPSQPNGGVFVAGGGNGSHIWSADRGVTWSVSKQKGMAAYRRLVSGGTRAAATGDGLLSLIDWPAGQSEPAWHDFAVNNQENTFLAYGNGVFVAIWYNAACYWLRDGYTWTACQLPANKDPVITSVVFANDRFYILGHGTPITSTDGQQWQLMPGGSGTDFRGVAFGSGRFAAPFTWSNDALKWTDANPQGVGINVVFGQLAQGACP